MRRREHQSGFGTVEILLVVLVVAVLAVAGLVVYQHHRNSTSKNNAATGSTQSTGQSQGSTSPQPAATTYFTVTEWGVRAPYSGSLKLSYTMSSDKRTATFSSDQLTALSSDCVGYGGSIIRWSKDDLVSEGTPTANTPTAASYFAGKDPSTYAHIADYYYMFKHAQSGCGNIDNTAATASQTNDAVKALVPNLQAIPN
jgi:Tfp pilus assembly protein PilV